MLKISALTSLTGHYEALALLQRLAAEVCRTLVRKLFERHLMAHATRAAHFLAGGPHHEETKLDRSTFHGVFTGGRSSAWPKREPGRRNQDSPYADEPRDLLTTVLYLS